VLALVRIGARSCRLVAVLLAVVVGLASQIGDRAVAQAKRPDLYLDAPAVSAERASRAGEVAVSYATSGSPASREVLAWLKVPVRPADGSRRPEYAAEAFASVVAPDDGEGGVTPSAALLAGEVMLAQLDASPPGGEDGDAGLASSDAVRPRLGDGTREPGEDEPDAAREQPSDTGSPPAAGTSAYASTSGAAVPNGEPSGAPGVIVSAPPPAGERGIDDAPRQALSAELASASPDTGIPTILAHGTDRGSYGSTGPVSDATGRAPTDSTTGSPGAENDEVEERPYPEESVPATEPGTATTSGEGEFAGPEPTGEEPTAEPVVEDTGPTSGEGAEIVLAPVPPPDAEEPTRTEEETEPVEEPPARPSADAGGSEVAYAEPPPPQDALEESTKSPEGAVPEPPADETDEGWAEIVVVGEEAGPEWTPTEAPAERPAADRSLTEQAWSEDVPAHEAPHGREARGEGGPSDGDTPRGDAGRERPSTEEPRAETPSAGEETPVEQAPAGASAGWEEAFAEGEPSADGPGVRNGEPLASPREGRRPDVARLEGAVVAETTAPVGEVAESQNGAPEGHLPPASNEGAPGNPREDGREGQRGENALLNNSGGGASREEARDLGGFEQGGGMIGRGRTMAGGTDRPSGGAVAPALPPEPFVESAPPATEEPVADARAPRVVEQDTQRWAAPRRPAGEQATYRRHLAAEQADRTGVEHASPIHREARPAQDPAPAGASPPAVIDTAPASETGGSPEDGSPQPKALSGAAQTDQSTSVEPNTQERGGK